MHILVADGDRHFLELLRGVIEREGHEVVIVTELERALAVVAGRMPHLVVAGMSLPGDGALKLVRHLRDLPDGRDTAVVLVGSGSQQERRPVQVLIAECGVRRVLRKPFPMFDLVDIVGDVDVELAGQPGDDEQSVTEEKIVPFTAEGGAAIGSDGKLSDVRLPQASTYLELALNPINLQRISRLWARRSSGVLRLAQGPGQAGGWMALGEGGPLDSAGWELISAALHGGRLEFETGRVVGAGDHLGLGAMIFGRVRDPGQTSFLRTVAFQALQRVRADAPLAALPLTPGTRRLLEAATPSRSLGEIVTAEGLSPDDVAPDLHALDCMGLVVLGEPIDVRPPDGIRTRKTAVQRRADRRSNELSMTSVDSSTQRRPPSAPQSRGSTASPGPRSQDSDPLSDVMSSPTQINPGGGMRARRADAGSEWPRVRRRLAERGRSWVSRHAARESDAERALRVERLRKELDRLEGHDPAVILGVPASSDRAMVDQAADRMRARYQSLSTNAALPLEGQRLAAEILAQVEQAHDDMLKGRGARKPAAPPLSEEEHLLKAGRERIDQKRWPEALALLRRARDRRLDHPGILSCLGWATLHDELLSEDQRHEDARGLMMLAVQFGPDDVAANLLLARYLEQVGEPDNALRFVRRVLRGDPDNAEAKGIGRRLEQKVDGD